MRFRRFLDARRTSSDQSENLFFFLIFQLFSFSILDFPAEYSSFIVFALQTIEITLRALPPVTRLTVHWRL